MVTKTVDLRSDTVTKPSEAMRAAMANAEVDDDVLGFDPTANRFEMEMAKIMGKEAALFVPSGTMGNLISVLVHCEVRGSEVILGDNSHINIYENGGISTIGSVHSRTVKNNSDGTMDIGLIEAAIRDPRGELYYPTTALICLENTHANCGGRCVSVEYTDRVGEIAKKHGLKLHIDGARIFNAATALGVPVHRLVQAADSVSVCLSKGLGAPVGSVIVGSKSFIAKAKRLRKTLGGGMRQVGILCAAAYVALQENVGKLEGDHRKAKLLADGLNKINGLRVNIASVETNIIFFDILKSLNITVDNLCKVLEEHGILLMPASSSSNLVANVLDVVGGTIENRLIPGDKLCFGMSQFFAEGQLPGARLIFSPRFVDNIFAGIVDEPRGLEVELFRKGKFGRVGVQNDRPMVRSYDREVTDGSVRKSGAPGDGPDGSVKALLDQLTSSFLIRPSKRDTRVSQVYHGGNTIQIPHNNLGDADRARQSANGGPRGGEDGKVDIVAPGQLEATGMVRASSHGVSVSVSVSEAKNTEFAERVRVESLSFGEKDYVGVEFLVMSEELSKGGLLCSPPAVPGENNHWCNWCRGMFLLLPRVLLRNIKVMKWQDSRRVYLQMAPEREHIVILLVCPLSSVRFTFIFGAEFKCVRDDAADGAEALDALVLDRDSGFAVVVRPINRNGLNKRFIGKEVNENPDKTRFGGFSRSWPIISPNKLSKFVSNYLKSSGVKQATWEPINLDPT
ncbi:hypothetical protein GIB67_026850 [Kingdonia uniflora]|uniref:Aromatic amino acid beta-eliminating lyase/threonine aldolase domain-containing protein n=1 Tax=Kingdonia uniflora TaxID=39325 RepID=A0A7J7M7S6_9MAGN|nr:hypothetical protein GIB67_026850 [Kingdonia uniflora]